ncbi:MAG: hypothetical protein AAF797_00635 [Planctomycetota bacterium]
MPTLSRPRDAGSGMTDARSAVLARRKLSYVMFRSLLVLPDCWIPKNVRAPKLKPSVPRVA